MNVSFCVTDEGGLMRRHEALVDIFRRGRDFTFQCCASEPFLNSGASIG
jgi:hypothetical protein